MGNSIKGYKFTIANGVVSAVYEIEKGRMKFERMDSNESWTVSGADIVKTETEHGRIETTTYTDADGDGIYTKAFKAYSAPVAPSPIAPGTPFNAGSTEGYKFDVANGSVTAVYEIEYGLTRAQRMDANETWTVDGASIVKHEVEHGLVETSTYTDVDGDGIYTKTAKSYTQQGTAWLGQSGTDHDDVWNGTYSNDHYFGGNGNDRLTGGYGDDEFYGADGDDRMSGDAGADHVYGGMGNDVISGGTGNDHLEGEEGDDTIVGGAGSDVLYGGAGHDTFSFLSAYDSGLSATTCDRICDFSDGDKIDLSAIDARSGNWTNDAFIFIGASGQLTSANANGALWFENGFLYASNDRDLAPEFEIELTGVTTFRAADIVL